MGRDAAPAGEARNLALGRLRESARAPLRALREELAGLGQGELPASQETRPGADGGTPSRETPANAVVERREARVRAQRARRASQACAGNPKPAGAVAPPQRLSALRSLT